MARLKTENLPAAYQQAHTLPSLPAVAIEILRLTESEDTTLDDLAQTLSMDPPLAAKILQLSNSAAFNLGAEATTLQRACMLLGLKTVKLMSLSFSFAGSLQSEGAGGLDYEQFWRRSIVCATAGRHLARETKSLLGDEAFLCGLLSHLGQLAAARCQPDEYATVVQEAGSAWPSSELEEQILGYTGNDVGTALMQSWSMPELITTALASREDPSKLPSDASARAVELCRIVMLAELLEEFLCGLDKVGAKERLDRAAKSFHALTHASMDSILLALEGEIQEIAEMLDVDVGSLDVQAMLAQAQAQLVQVSIGVAIDNKQAERKMRVLASLNEELTTKVYTDKLTGLPSRAGFDEVLAACARRRAEGGSKLNLGLLMFDIDHFKQFNDEHGHQAGDEVLRMVGRVLARATRDSDLAWRYGGEEFAVLMPETTPEGLRTLAERIRSSIEEETVEVDGKQLGITVSIGGICVEHLGEASESALLLKAADHYLVQAKKAGRNRCCFHPRTSLTRS